MQFVLVSLLLVPLHFLSPPSQINLVKTPLLPPYIFLLKYFQEFPGPFGWREDDSGRQSGSPLLVLNVSVCTWCPPSLPYPAWILHSCWLFPLSIPSACHVHAKLLLSSYHFLMQSSIWILLGPRKILLKTQIKGHLPYAIFTSSSRLRWTVSSCFLILTHWVQRTLASQL